MNDQIIELRPQPLKLERYCIIVFQGYERWSFCLGNGAGKIKGELLRSFAPWARPSKKETTLYEHPLDTDTPLLRTVCFVRGKLKKAFTFSLNSTRLIRIRGYYGQFLCPLSIRINGVSKYLKTRGVMWKILPNRFHTMVTSLQNFVHRLRS